MKIKNILFASSLLLLITCGKEAQPEGCELTPKIDCAPSNGITALSSCSTQPFFYDKNIENNFLYKSSYPINLPVDYTIIDMNTRKSVGEFSIPGNTSLRYWFGNYFYYLNSEGLMKYDITSKVTTKLIETNLNLSTQQLNDKLYVLEHNNYRFLSRLFEIDLTNGKVKTISNPSRENDKAKHIYLETRNNEIIIVTMLEDRRVEYNDSKKIDLGEIPLNIPTKIKSFTTIAGNIFYYQTDQGSYFYDLKNKTSILGSNEKNIYLLNGEYFLINDVLHTWKDMKEVSSYKGPKITASNSALHYIANETVYFIDGNNLNMQKFNEDKPYKTITYCRSLMDYRIRTIYNGELFLVDFNGKGILKMAI